MTRMNEYMTIDQIIEQSGLPSIHLSRFMRENDVVYWKEGIHTQYMVYYRLHLNNGERQFFYDGVLKLR